MPQVSVVLALGLVNYLTPLSLIFLSGNKTIVLPNVIVKIK